MAAEDGPIVNGTRTFGASSDCPQQLTIWSHRAESMFIPHHEAELLTS